MRRILAWEGRTRDLFVADNSQMVLKVQVLRNQQCIDKNECDWKLFSEFPAQRSVLSEASYKSTLDYPGLLCDYLGAGTFELTGR